MRRRAMPIGCVRQYGGNDLPPLEERSRAFAAYLQQGLGLKKATVWR